MDLQDVGEVIGGLFRPPSYRAGIQYGRQATGRRGEEARPPVESWAPLAELVDVDEFERVGAFREVMKSGPITWIS